MQSMYVRFAFVLTLSLVLMFVLSMSMVRTLAHFYINLSNFYMALIMVAAMALVMLVGMWGMFQNQRLNMLLVAGFAVLFFAGLILGRTETLVGNEGMLRSMIPHHSRAILVCEESDLTDPEIVALCETIVQTQREEIRQMEAILDRY